MGEGEGEAPPRERFRVEVRPATEIAEISPETETAETRPATHAETAVLVLVGELDRDTVDPLREALEEHRGADRIVVDCSALRFCDSSGLNALLKARLRMRETSGRLELAGIRRPVARMFEITGARTVFRVYGTVDEALSERGREGGGIHGREG
ncbi:STAS domain-containing protein [Streptomyces sp. NPDC055103]